MTRSTDARRVRAAATLCSLLSCVLPIAAHAQNPAFRVTAGNAQPVILSSDLPSFRAVGTTTFFVARTPATGSELWKTDSTTGAALVKDINPGSADSNPVPLADANGVLFFVADDGAHGAELWKTDGTAAGTALVKDINPGGATSNPSSLTEAGGVLFFVADDGAHGPKLWRTDDAGTVLLNPGSPWRTFFALAGLNGTLIFQVAGDYSVELWRSDGTVPAPALPLLRRRARRQNP